jgi:hypothetical protein
MAQAIIESEHKKSDKRINRKKKKRRRKMNKA